MKLKDRSQSPVGGYFFTCPDGRRIFTQSTLSTLIDMVEAYYSSNGIEIPSDLDEIIEDQICQRQPESKCKYSGLGDRIAQGIHILAGAVDAVAGTELKKKAKRCSTCGSRRQKLNKISS